MEGKTGLNSGLRVAAGRSRRMPLLAPIPLCARETPWAWLPGDFRFTGLNRTVSME